MYFSNIIMTRNPTNKIIKHIKVKNRNYMTKIPWFFDNVKVPHRKQNKTPFILGS